MKLIRGTEVNYSYNFYCKKLDAVEKISVDEINCDESVCLFEQ